jgi:hypothetical protein
MRRKVRLKRRKFDVVVEGKCAAGGGGAGGGGGGAGEQYAAGAAAVDVDVGANVIVAVVDECEIATGVNATVMALKGCNIQWK